MSWSRHNSSDIGATGTAGLSGSRTQDFNFQPIRAQHLESPANYRRTTGNIMSSCIFWKRNWISFQGKGNEDVWPDKWIFGWKNGLQLHGLLNLILTILNNSNIFICLNIYILRPIWCNFCGLNSLKMKDKYRKHYIVYYPRSFITKIQRRLFSKCEPKQSNNHGKYLVGCRK